MKRKKLTTQAIRRFIFLMLTVLSFIIQCTWLPDLNISFPVFLLIPLIVSISMFEREFAGMIFGLIAGILWDLASPVTDGFLALFFAFFGCLAGLLTHYVLRNTLLSAIVLCTGGTLVFSGINMLFSFMSNGFAYGDIIFLKTYLPATAAAVILTFPYYIFIRKIAVRFHSDTYSESSKR